MLPAGGKGLSLDAQLVIIAIGQVPELDPFTAEILEDSGSKVFIDEFGMTPLTGLYAGGDLVKQRPAVVDAIASGKRAAIAIDAGSYETDPAKIFPSFRLGSGPSLSVQVYQGRSGINVKQVVQFSELNTLPYGKIPPHLGPKVSPKARTRDFEEVNKGLDRASAVDEAKRCFYCGTCIGCDLCFLLCPDLSILKTGFKDYSVSADFCKGCSQCATTCPRHVIDMGEAPGSHGERDGEGPQIGAPTPRVDPSEGVTQTSVIGDGK
jgi:Pyruvate/2-oxoacid:ferredoxin oxidoreductase delta subunit